MEQNMATYPNNYQRKKTIYWNDGSTARVLYPDEQDKQYRDYGNTAPKAEPVYEPAPKKQEQQTPKKERKVRTYAKPGVDHNIMNCKVPHQVKSQLTNF